MLIRLVLLALFFLWVVKQPDAYRDSIREKIWAKDSSVAVQKDEKEKTEKFLYAVGKYKVGDPSREQAVEDLATARWQILLFDDAERLYKVSLFEKGQKRDAKVDLTRTMINLATVLTAEQKFDEAIMYYKRVLDWDKKCSPKNDPLLGRDYNNLGLATYLKASSKERGPTRQILLKEANNYYNQALQIYKSQTANRQGLSVALCNQHLCLRDMGDIEGAQLAKVQELSIDSQNHRLFVAP